VSIAREKPGDGVAGRAGGRGTVIDDRVAAAPFGSHPA